MSEPVRHVCPECGTPREADNASSCTCTRHAADARLKSRTAEDFDPLRVRPYVELQPGAEDTPAHREPGAARPSDPAWTAGTSDASDTIDVSVTVRVPHPAEPSAEEETPSPEAESVALPAPLAPPATMPSAAGADLSDVCESQAVLDAPRRGADHRRPGRSRRALLLGAAGAVVAAAGLAGGLFSYDTPSPDGADVPASAPEASSPDMAAPPSSARPSSSRSARPSPSAARPSRSAKTAQAPSTARATGPVVPAASRQDGNAPVLSRGGKGSEVTELQLRLRQLDFYTGEVDGDYDGRVEAAVRRYQMAHGIKTDERGVYDKATRQNLESETEEPPRP